MSAHDEQHENWLLARLAGEDLPAAAIETIESCTACRATLSDLRQIESALDAAGNFERAGIKRVFPSGEAVGSAVGSRDDLAAARNRRRNDTAFGRASKVAAAILVVGAIGFALRAFRAPSHAADAGPALGSVEGADLQPSGVVAVVGEFVFDAKLPSGGSFLVRVYDPAAGGASILVSPPLLEPRWIPDPANIAKLPAHFRWEAQVLDATGVKLSSASADVVVRSR